MDDKEQLNKYEQGHLQLLNFIEPYLSDFTGINDKGQFDLIEAVKEIINDLVEENNYLKEYKKKSSTCQECYSDGYITGLTENKTLKNYKDSILKIKYYVNQIKKRESIEEVNKILDIINKLRLK